jgi:glycosyltransferase involved in cell wall biosynthesis
MILKFGKERHNESSKGTESFHCVELIAYQPNDIRVGNYTSFNQKQKDIFEGGCIPTILDDTISNKVKKLDTSKTARCKDAEELPFQLFIFGEGTYEKAIQELAHKYKTIHYFGWQNLETIRRYTSNCNFILFPSTCLESFGLTALTGIARGLPVIGYAKGGAKPFIEPDLDLDTINGQNLPDKLYHLIHLLNKEDVFVNSLPTTEIVKEYSKENRQAAIAYHLGEKKRILIVSDFRNRI